MGSLGTEPGYNAHRPSEICIDSFQATTGRMEPCDSAAAGFPTLMAVIDHYNRCFSLGLNAQEKSDLVQYLKSL
jgi:hypothetical protein